ncbi:MAG: hypothetical protein JNK30_10305 [Phenylobacterium sp.]|uniref:hypothetical protein n=1 Tax=Phenylobacterium sp. TaxID=1871053 RepID=UPI001A3BDEF5|nr:hypothetical protein [Phenylobacterium sp.]MBL8771762.1 hypothetical protein [Phenylobacterium sp.]
MLLKMAQLEAIRRGELSVVLRRWRRPTVRSGGTLNTALGQLAIDQVEAVEAVTDADAVSAGYPSAAAACSELAGEGTLYRIRVRFLGADPRAALREDTDLTGVLAALRRLDARGPWTARVLDLIAEHPARRAGDLAAMLGRETLPFKQDVRKLKALGLTESLEVGYRLSPRGQAVRKAMMAG